ncbi:hypothetical protein N7478_009673 [Penicillium angulare]|uniref:uncharacterized protein n=1 Tax=Penicillium angulare TaxID=116970 RepID=UPI002540490B|nr:uncharacterized protein N7478_009673 [Penicillium angulare]KAJ5266865.1 hypothetical protein N7478_009673 [Penicillium angulare]
MASRPAGFPLLQLAILVILTSVIPYMPDMVEYVGVPKSDVPKWVGITATVTATCAGSVGVIWGIISDYTSRKYVILFELLLMVAFALLFGFSQSLAQLVSSRALLGLVNGNIGILRTMVAEMVTEKQHQPRAFSVLPIAWTIGSGVGPVLGGALVHPAQHYPKIFGDAQLFIKYPFVLPNMVATCCVAVAILIAFLFLQETQSGRENKCDYGLTLGRMLWPSWTSHKGDSRDVHSDDDERAPLLDANREQTAEDSEQRRAGKPCWKDVFSIRPSLILLTYGGMGMHTMAFDSLLPVLLHYPVQQLHGNPDVQLPFKFNSGFGLDANKIGPFYIILAVSGVVFQAVVFPWVAQRIGVLRCLRLSSILFPILYLTLPFIPLIPPPLCNLGVGMLLVFKQALSTCVFPCCTILLSHAAANLGILGTLNGMGTSISAFGRAIGPVIIGSAFSFGVKRGYMIIPWWTLAGSALLTSLPLLWITDSNEEDQQADDHSE